MTTHSPISAAIKAGVFSATSVASFIYALARDPKSHCLVTVEAIWSGNLIRPMSAYLTASPSTFALIDTLLDNDQRSVLADKIRKCLIRQGDPHPRTSNTWYAAASKNGRAAR